VINSTPESKTPHKFSIAGILLTAFGFLSSGFVMHFIPDQWADVIKLLGAVLTAFGVTGQISQNTKATVAQTETIKQVTSAPPDLAPNPSIARAQASARPANSPLLGG
jgi:hypothetical protein